MSAKVTITIYILVSLEIGLLLLIMPWYSQFWEENFFLYLMTEKFNASWLPSVITSGWVRGGVTGLGLLNVVIAVWEIANFRRAVAELSERLSGQSPVTSDEQNRNEADDPPATGATSLSDNQSTEFPPPPKL